MVAKDISEKETSVPKPKFRLQHRIADFVKQFDPAELKSSNLQLYAFGWFITFAIILFSHSSALAQLALIVHIYLWFKLYAKIENRIYPISEFLLIFFFLIYLFEYGLFQALIPISPSPPGFQPGIFFNIVQLLLLSLLVLAFGTLIIRNNDGKPSVVIIFILLAILFHLNLSGGNEILFLVIQIILFLLLLRRTTWLEELSKIECWLYLVGIFIFYQAFNELKLFEGMNNGRFQNALLWYSIPYYMFSLFKFYLLALMIKIPLVLIYNHASLSRKLKISGLFQSTFPQLIQLIVLLLMFYFFISGWQAEKLRSSFQDLIDDLRAGSFRAGIRTYSIPVQGDRFSIKLEDYEPSPPLDWTAEHGVVAMQKASSRNDFERDQIDYFLFTKLSLEQGNRIFLVKVDSSLLELLGEELNLLAGTSIWAYPLSPGKWSSYIYQMDFWQTDRSLQIFPFAMLPGRDVNLLTATLPDVKADTAESTVTARIQIGGQSEFTMGRLFMPLWSADQEAKDYLAFDIVLQPKPSFFWSGLAQIVYFMIIAYLLLNAFIIRRVVSLGADINKTIVQKFNQLKSGIQEIATGNLNYKIELEGEDEFVELAGHFNQMGDRLNQTLAEMREKDRLQFELQNARNVQLSLLPRRLPEIPGYKISASLKTATEVGGDFYDSFPLAGANSNGSDSAKTEKRFLITIGDVSGKGSSAAFYMAQCMSLIRFSRQFTDDPVEICLRLNDYFTWSIIDRQIFVTAIMGILDINTHTLTLVRAGHTQPIFIPAEKNQKVRFLDSRGLGIGLTAQSELFRKTLQVLPIKFEVGDKLVFYTDGVIEASRPVTQSMGDYASQREVYDEERLEKQLIKNRGKSAEEIKNSLDIDLETFYGNHPKVDDHTLVVIERKGFN